MDIENLSGKVFGQYELRQFLGKGAMGAVYRAYQVSLDREVAIKILSSSFASQKDYVQRFSREAKTSASLGHPHIIPVYDYGTQDGAGYIVMRLLTGGCLDDQINQDEGHSLPSLAEAAKLLRQLASALDYAHRRGVVHRDIKPKNIMFDDEGDAYVVDFGIAKLMQSVTTSITDSGAIYGTPAFISPELWQSGVVSGAVDQYALGVLMYMTLTGRLPFESDSIYALMHKHLYDMPPPPEIWRASIPPTLKPVFDRVMAKDYRERYSTCGEFATAFEQAISGPEAKPIAESTMTPLAPAGVGEAKTVLLPSANQRSKPDVPADSAAVAVQPDPKQRMRWRVLVAGALILLVGAAGVWLLSRNGRDGTEPPGVNVVAAISIDEERGTLTALAAVATSEVSTIPTLSPTLPSTATNTPTLTEAPTLTATIMSSQTPTETQVAPTNTATVIPTGTATGVPVCASLTNFAINGSLTPNVWQEKYTFAWPAGCRVSLTVHAPAFDLYLVLEDSSGNIIAYNDDCFDAHRACIQNFPVTESDVYTVVVESFDRSSTGTYILDITLDPGDSPPATFAPAAPFLGLTGTPTPTNTPSTCALPPYVVITTPSTLSYVNVRAVADTTAVRVAQVYNGECFHVLGRTVNGTWYKIHIPDRGDGWILASLGPIAAGQPPVPAIATSQP